MGRGLRLPGTGSAWRLLERDSEVSALARSLELARVGNGQVLLIEGPAGIGKTALVQAARRLGTSEGFTTLQARGAPLEVGFPFGVVRQLLERIVARMPPNDRAELFDGAAGPAAPILGLGGAAATGGGPWDEDVTGARFGALHGLYWLVANLAERAPLLLTADDAQWADLPSLRSLLHIARRVGDIPAAIFLVVRRGEPGAAASLFAEFLAESPVQVLRPSPLSQAAVATLVKAMLAGTPEAEFCRACHRASGGNPFVLHELLGQLARERIAPSATESWRIPQLRPTGVAREVLARIKRLGTDAIAMTRAKAVLGADAQPYLLARLAGCSEDEAAAALDALIAAGLLTADRSFEFIHSLVRDAVYDDIPPAKRTLMHHRAAQVLAAEKAAPQSISAHLVHARPGTEPWAAETLHLAAVSALHEGAPELAVTYLRRAMAESPRGACRAAIITDLGRAAGAALDPAAVADLKAALSECSEPRVRASLTLMLTRLFLHQGFLEEAIHALEDEIASLSKADRNLALQLEAELILSMQIHPARHSESWQRLDRIDPEHEPDGLGKQLLMAGKAGAAGFRGESAGQTAVLAEAALTDWRTLVDEAAGSGLLASAICALIWCDRLDQAEQTLAALLPYALKRGSIFTAALLAPFRADIAYRRGDIPDAETYAREATVIAPDSGLMADSSLALGFLIEAFVEKGDIPAAEKTLDQLPIGGRVPGQFYWLLHERGILMSAKGNHAGALDAHLFCGQRHLASGCLNPAVSSWRSSAALASSMLGLRDQARQLVSEELAAARRFGAPRAIGIALRAAGVIEQGPGSLDLLAEAVSVLEHSGARLELARALVDYGAALRRGGQRADARDPLRRALDLATRCGAPPLAQRARWELQAAGARPRRALLTGADALTVTERHVATMAADGMTNRQIAEHMFISMKTVSIHLTHAYQKLGIATRSELASTLNGKIPRTLHLR